MGEQITIKTPGKLMVAGEFAVLEPEKSLVVMAVDRFVSVTIEATAQNVLSLTDFEHYHLDWEYQAGKVQIDTDDPRVSFVQEAMGVALLYLKENGVSLYPVALTIKSELADVETGKKYGLGSSAAVVTAVVRAILTQFLPKAPENIVVFKLASIAHVNIQGNGSGADIAASTYGGILHYKSFQAEHLLALLETEKSMKQMVEQPWRYLTLEPVQLPEGLELVVGWTGNPASTGSLVKEIAKLDGETQTENSDKTIYGAFLRASDRALIDVLRGMKENDVQLFLKGIEANRIALAGLGKAADVAIETPLLETLSAIAKEIGGAGKLSGAGGGDCGIAFVQSAMAADILRKAWANVGITPLELAIFEYGVEA